jgi:hypothetical protein
MDIEARGGDVARRSGASEPNLQFLDWANGFGYNTTNAWISMTWVESSQQIAMCLRDGQRTTTGYDYLAPLGEVPADGRWHHVAAVKTNSWLTVYVDYRRTANVPLSGAASGVYQFAAASLAYVGRTLGSGNITTTNQWLDELRISSRGLRSREFLCNLANHPSFAAGFPRRRHMDV